MTPGTAGRVTPGPWRIDDAFGTPWNISNFGHEAVALFAQRTPHGPDPERRANTELAVAAVNAMFALNPTDPLSAAQGLEALVKAASELLPVLQVSVRRLRYQKPGDEFWPNREEGEVSLDAFAAALSRVTGQS